MVPRDSTILLMGLMDSEHEASLHAFFSLSCTRPSVAQNSHRSVTAPIFEDHLCRPSSDVKASSWLWGSCVLPWCFHAFYVAGCCPLSKPFLYLAGFHDPASVNFSFTRRTEAISSNQPSFRQTEAIICRFVIAALTVARRTFLRSFAQFVLLVWCARSGVPMQRICGAA